MSQTVKVSIRNTHTLFSVQLFQIVHFVFPRNGRNCHKPTRSVLSVCAKFSICDQDVSQKVRNITVQPPINL